MEIKPLSEHAWCICGAVNMGLVEAKTGLIAIDTGLDKQSAKILLRAAETIGRPIVAIVNTHAHADHYGGNAFLVKHRQIPVYAPRGEAEVMRRPLLEPEYLWHGAKPLPGLKNKFLLAEVSAVQEEFLADSVFEVDGLPLQVIALPGHAAHQVGILAHDVFFAADAYFDTAVVDKHGIPFMVNYEATLFSAKKVATTKAAWVVPGHGAPSFGAPTQAIEHLVRRHEEIFAKVIGHIERAAPSFEELMTHLCQALNLQPSHIGALSLLSTPVAAYLTAAVENQMVEVNVEGGRCSFRRCGKDRISF